MLRERGHILLLLYALHYCCCRGTKNLLTGRGLLLLLVHAKVTPEFGKNSVHILQNKPARGAKKIPRVLLSDREGVVMNPGRRFWKRVKIEPPGLSPLLFVRHCPQGEEDTTAPIGWAAEIEEKGGN